MSIVPFLIHGRFFEKEEKREYEKMYEATTGKVTHKILIEISDEAYNYWKQRAKNEGRSMQNLIASMVCLFPKAKAVTDAFMGREQK